MINLVRPPITDILTRLPAPFFVAEGKCIHYNVERDLTVSGMEHNNGVTSPSATEERFSELSAGDLQRIGSFFVYWTARGPEVSSEEELIDRLKDAIREFLSPSAFFLAIPHALSSRFEVSWETQSRQHEAEEFSDFLRNILSSGIDSISLELLESLPFLQGFSKILVKSSPALRERILLLALNPGACSMELGCVLLKSLEQLFRMQLESLRYQSEAEKGSKSLSGLHKTAEGLSRELFYSSELLRQMSEEAREVLHAGAAAVLVPTDETRTAFTVRGRSGFDSDHLPLSTALFSQACADFVLHGRKAVTYRAGRDTFFLVPLIRRGEPNGVLFFYSNDPEFVLADDQIRVAEIYGFWISVAMESVEMFERVSLSQTVWENTFDSIADPIYIIDNEYNLKKINKSLAALTMQSIKLPLNRNCYRYLFNQTSICSWCPVPKGLETNKPETVEAPLFAGGPWQIQTFPFKDKSDRRIGSINVLRDMSLLKGMQEQLIESEKLASIGKLISGVAHEVRNPLFGISATVRALANELEGKQEIKPFLDIIMSETARLNRLMEDLLSYSRPARIDKNPSDLAEVVREVIEHFKLVPGARDADIRFLESDRVPPINVDRNGIKQVLLNLFENGMQHAGESPEVSVFLEYLSFSSPPEIHLVVKDNGAGIHPDVLPRVFDPFFTTRSRGTGLGLSIVRKVIHDHGGRISVESHPGIGTTFRITLPVMSRE